MNEVHAARGQLFSILIGDAGDEHENGPMGGVPWFWRSIFEVADCWRVLPALRRRIAELGLKPSAAESAELAARCRAAFVSSASVCAAGARIGAYLERSGIPYVLFKGIAAIAQIYGGPAERTTVDADILIRERDLSTAIQALGEIGVRPSDGGDLAAYIRSIRNMPGFAGNEAIELMGGTFQRLDLHWSLGTDPDSEMAAGEIIARGIRRNILGSEVCVLSPVDGFILGAHHAVRNNFAPDRMVRDVLDAVRWLDLLRREGLVGEVITRAKSCRLGPAVFGLGTLAGCEAGIAELSCPDGFDLVELFHLQLEQPLGNDLASLFDARAIASVARGVLGNSREYRKYLSQFDMAQAGKARPIKSRIAAVFATLRALRRNRGKAYRALRTLARVKAAYQRAGTR